MSVYVFFKLFNLFLFVHFSPDVGIRCFVTQFDGPLDLSVQKTDVSDLVDDLEAKLKLLPACSSAQQVIEVRRNKFRILFYLHKSPSCGYLDMHKCKFMVDCTQSRN